jgi:hypothetical protein
MAQATDYSLANQSGANFRAELNTILAASVSQNSGSTAPTTIYAFQFWIDTGVSPALLKIRNSANSAWITVGDVTAANLGLLTSATAASTYAPIASPTFTGTVTIPAGASISGFLTSATAASTYLALAGGTLTGDVTLNAQSDLRFADLDSSNWVALQAPSSISSNYTLTLPAADGTSNQALTTNGSGALAFSSVALLATAQAFSAAQRGSVVALTDGATITPDFSLGNNYSVTLGGSRTLANPTNLTAGQSGVIVVTQDGTGSRTLAFGANWKFPGGTAPTLTTTAAAVDVLAYYVESSSRITARVASDVK